jgi:formylglycine-generating enzyme required for sulfatase activity
LAPGGGALVVHAVDKSFTNSSGMEVVLIPAGSFTMGTDKKIFEGAYASDDETQGHRVRVSISRPFYLGRYEVTQEQWAAVMRSNPSYFQGWNNPVENVSWGDVQEFVMRLNRQEGHARYRLPTEAEWEYAARGGTDTEFFFMQDPKTWNKAAYHEATRQLDAYAWVYLNSGNTTHPVGEKKPNPFGLYDVYGNVWEWVQDWDGELPAVRETTDYTGPASGWERVLRGGGWFNDAVYCRSAGRHGFTPDHRYINIGFRLALSLE